MIQQDRPVLFLDAKRSIWPIPRQLVTQARDRAGGSGRILTTSAARLRRPGDGEVSASAA